MEKFIEKCWRLCVKFVHTCCYHGNRFAWKYIFGAEQILRFLDNLFTYLWEMDSTADKKTINLGAVHFPF
jgi:hypothetical protein